MFNKISMLIACGCLFVAGMASAQWTRNEYGLVAPPEYQVKADSMGTAFGCLALNHTQSLFEGLVLLEDQPMDSTPWDTFSQIYGRAAEAGLCATYGRDALFYLEEENEGDSEWVLMKIINAWGRQRAMWTRREWFEVAR